MTINEIKTLYITKYGDVDTDAGFELTVRKNYKNEFVATLWFDPPKGECIEVVRQVFYDANGVILRTTDKTK